MRIIVNLNMLFWISCAILTLAAIIVVFAPCFKTSAVFENPSDLLSDLEIYKDQLDEVGRDEQRGLLSYQEAVNSRIEISHRMLKYDEKYAVSLPQKTASKIILTLIILTIPLFSWGLYSVLGRPDLTDQPLYSRSHSVMPTDRLEDLVEKAQAHLERNPNDGRGWQVLAPIYFKLKLFDKAVHSYQMAIKLNPPSADLEIGLGKSLTQANGGLINNEARLAFNRAIKMDETNKEPQFLFAVDLAKQNKLTEAKIAFEELLKTTASTEPLFELIQTMIGKINKTKQPSQNDINNAAEMSIEDRDNMIQSMVSRLNDRLLNNPQDSDGWLRLVRSYIVLREPKKALDALKKARGFLKKQEDLQQLKELELEIGSQKP
jgi:cytochrome c-type biogenesis protein CcmH